MRSLFKLTLVFISMLLFFFIYFVWKGDQKLKEQLPMLHSLETFMEFDQDLGYRFKSNVTFSWEEMFHDSTYHDKYISTDSLRRRTVNNNFASQYLLFLGCSYTIGQGLNDEESFPYILNDRQDKYQVYDYASTGYGAQQLIPIFNKPIRNEIKEDSGILIYMFIDHHVNRLAKDIFSVNFSFFTPYFVFEDNKVVNKGLYYEYFPIKTRLVLGVSNTVLYDVWDALEQRFFWDWDSNYKFTAKVIKTSQEAYLRQFPKGKYYVVIFPGEKNEIKSYLEKEGLNIIDLSESINLEEIGGRQKDAYHPNEVGASAIAELLLGVIDTL